VQVRTCLDRKQRQNRRSIASDDYGGLSQEQGWWRCVEIPIKKEN